MVCTGDWQLWCYFFSQPIQDKEILAEDEQTFLARQQVSFVFEIQCGQSVNYCKSHSIDFVYCGHWSNSDILFSCVFCTITLILWLVFHILKTLTTFTVSALGLSCHVRVLVLLVFFWHALCWCNKVQFLLSLFVGRSNLQV